MDPCILYKVIEIGKQGLYKILVQYNYLTIEFYNLMTPLLFNFFWTQRH